MKLYKTIIYLSVILVICSCSCNKQVADSKTRNVKYVIIDGEKVEINATTDTSTIITDTSYYKNKTIPRKYIKEE